MDAIYTYRHYTEDNRPRLQFPKRTGRRTTYAQWLAYQYALHHDDELPAAALTTEPPPPPAPAFVNHGRWLWQCPACLTAVQVSETAGAVDLCCCTACFGQGFVQPSLPDARAEIEAELLRQPGYRHNAPFRNWEPGWTLEFLQERTAAAQAKIAAGEKFIRSASIGTPRTWAVGEVLTAANMNTFVREIQKDLIGLNGAVELLHGMRPGSFSTTEIDALTGTPDGTLVFNSTTGQPEYISNDMRRSLVSAMHTSSLFAAGSVMTVSHDLGFAPTRFQLAYERIASSAQHGFAQDDRVYVGEVDKAPGWAVFDVTATEYKVAMMQSSQPVMWTLDNSGDELWAVDPRNPGNEGSGYGLVGSLPPALTDPSGLLYHDDALWTLNVTSRPNELWKLDPGNPGRVTGGFGNQGDIYDLWNTNGVALYALGSDIIALRTDASWWRINPAAPDDESGDYGQLSSQNSSANAVTVYNGFLYTLNNIRQVHRWNPSDPGDSGSQYGLQGQFPTGSIDSSMATDMAFYDDDLWVAADASNDLWRFNTADYSQITGIYGDQGSFPSGLSQPRGLVLGAGDPLKTASITPKTGGQAGSAVQITVDNDAAAGGWGARMLAFA